MPDTFQLEVATPERLLVDEQVTQAELPGKNGYLGVLPGHAPLLSALGAGVLTYASSDGQRVLAIDGGFAVRALLGSQRRKDGSVVRTAAV